MSKHQHLKRSGTKANAQTLEVAEITDDRMEVFARNLAQGKSVYQAAIESGYSENYAKTSIYRTIRTSDRFKQIIEGMASHNVDLIRALYQVNLLPKAFKIDEKVLDEMGKKPDKAMKYPKTLERVHKIAGLLADQTVQVNLVPVNVAIAIQNVFEGQETAPKEVDTVLIKSNVRPKK